jgi:3-methyladenine DNA glycosylase AlkD
MHVDEVCAELERLGTEQIRKTYRRHGVAGPQYGVSYAHLDALAKRLKTDQPLAEALWTTGNHDARVLATRVADAASITAPVLTAWAADLDSYVLTDALAGLVARTPHARSLADAWLDHDGEWVSRTGWLVVANLALHDAALPDAYSIARLATIEQVIHTRPNWVRAAMNSALIAIGVRNADLEAQALAAAARIGRVKVDHGQTACKTPDAAAYIAKTWARRRPRAS